MSVLGLLNKNNYLDDQKKYNERILVCNRCPEQKFNRLALQNQCKICKCLTDLKAKLKDESCPIGKW